MRVCRGFSSSSPQPTALAIGNFDGVHLGHAAIARQLVACAQKLDVVPAMLTFEPHPREFFSKADAPARLTTLREKLELLAALGIEQTTVLRFNATLANLSAPDFIRQLLVDQLRVRHLIVGDDFRFGKARQGDFALLCQAGAVHGFDVETLPAVTVDGCRVSSSGVREALAAGEMEQAAAYLGRPYIMDGKVAHGQKLGRQLGFATANLHIKHDPLPMRGVFAVEVTGLGESPIRGVANLGVRPTVGGVVRPLLEVHLFDFSRDIYGAHISVRFVHKLRNEHRFPSLDALKAQIANDVAAARAFFHC